MDDATSTFLDQLDEFAARLDSQERTMLRILIGDDDEATGFGMDSGWPGARTLVPALKIGVLDGVIRGPISNGDLGSGRIIDGRPISSTDLGSGRFDQA